MSNAVKFRHHRRHRGGVCFLFGVLLGGVAILWVGNTIVVELFQAPAIQFKHAVAFQAACQC